MDSSPNSLEFNAPSVEELQPLFPAYEIGGFIAQGGMGAIYSARQISLDRPVAIKILPRKFGADPKFRASFEAEAKSMARLNHPNLIGVYDFGDIDGMLFIIMELVKGKSLHHSAHGKADRANRGGPPGGRHLPWPRPRPPGRHSAPRHQARQHPPRPGRPTENW
ncbi:MAG: protein kinase [Akkermansiaceae bacterium]|nr:protein kinase [Akkermansiaceae bacterium]